MNKSSNNILIIDNVEDGILRLTLDDQENKNALSKTTPSDASEEIVGIFAPPLV